MKKLLALLVLAAPLLAQTPTPTPTSTPTPTRTPTPTPTVIPPSRYALATQVKPGFGNFSTESTVNKLGDTYYAVDYRTFARLAGNTSTTKKFKCQTGTGTISAPPFWCSIASGDVPALAYVTSVGNGTIGSLFSVSWATSTTTPALSLNLAAQSANCVIAGPTSGGSAVPTCRSLVTGDFPASGVSATTYGDASHVAQVTVDATGRVTSAASVAISAGTGITSINADTTAAQVIAAGSGIGVSTAGGTTTISFTGGGGAHTGWVLADPNFSVGTSYERVAKAVYGRAGLVQLAPQKTWTETIANAKTSVPGGWTLGNSGNLNAADENTTTANALYLKGLTSGTFTGANAPLFYKTYEYTSSQGTVTFLSRISSSNCSASNIFCLFWLADDGTPASFWYAGFNNLNGASAGCQGGNNAASTNATCTTSDGSTGIWFRIDVSGRDVVSYFTKANVSTPPASGWTLLRHDATALGDGEKTLRVGFTVARSSSTTNVDMNVLYFDDAYGVNLLAATSTGTPAQAATGFDGSSPVLTLVTGFDLGSSSATVADADAQAALAEITNPRSTDTATWTWSVTRGASSPVACGSYAAAGSVTVGGSGRYLSVCAKAASTNRAQPGSVNATALRIPFAP